MLKSIGSSLRSSRWQPVRCSRACWQSSNPRCAWGQERPPCHSSRLQYQLPGGLEPFFPLPTLLQGPSERGWEGREAALRGPLLGPFFLPPPLTTAEEVAGAMPAAKEVAGAMPATKEVAGATPTAKEFAGATPAAERASAGPSAAAPPAPQDSSATLCMLVAGTDFPDVPASKTRDRPLRESLPTGRLDGVWASMQNRGEEKKQHRRGSCCP
ncbi:hypothetical protein AOLI_G00202650 [Acnodon oligacanthus]